MCFFVTVNFYSVVFPLFFFFSHSDQQNSLFLTVSKDIWFDARVTMLVWMGNRTVEAQHKDRQIL